MTDRIGYSYRRYLLRADGRIALIYRLFWKKCNTISYRLGINEEPALIYKISK